MYYIYCIICIGSTHYIIYSVFICIALYVLYSMQCILYMVTIELLSQQLGFSTGNIYLVHGYLPDFIICLEINFGWPGWD